MKLREQRVIACRRALTLLDDALRARPKRAPSVAIGDERDDRSTQLGGVAHEPAGVGCEQIVDGLLEAEIVRPEQHGHAEDRGLHEIVAALVRAAEEQAAADEREICDRIEAAELADGVDDEHAARPGAGAAPASTAVLRVTAKPRAARALLDGLRVGRIARHDDERRGGARRARGARRRRAALRPLDRASCRR